VVVHDRGQHQLVGIGARLEVRQTAQHGLGVTYDLVGLALPNGLALDLRVGICRGFLGTGQLARATLA
jgi:hypothetical protein